MGSCSRPTPPQNLFDYPRNLFVATFIGSPAMNLVGARLVRDGGPAVTFADTRLPVPEELLGERPGLDQYLDREVIIGIRPSDFEDASLLHDESRPKLKAEVAIAEELGSEVNLMFVVAAPPVTHEVMLAKFDKAATEEAEAEVLAGANETFWTARVNPKTRARAGHKLELAVDTHNLHFFDPESGNAIGHRAYVSAPAFR
jgi:multiple sugar transport system ATP-binding protein